MKDQRKQGVQIGRPDGASALEAEDTWWPGGMAHGNCHVRPRLSWDWDVGRSEGAFVPSLSVFLRALSSCVLRVNSALEVLPCRTCTTYSYAGGGG